MCHNYLVWIGPLFISISSLKYKSAKVRRKLLHIIKHIANKEKLDNSICTTGKTDFHPCVEINRKTFTHDQIVTNLFLFAAKTRTLRQHL